MKFTKLIVASGSIALLASSLALAAVDQSASTSTTDTSKTMSAKNSADSEALEFLIVVDTHEIDAADMASKKTVSKEVFDYAQMLHQDHDKNRTDTLNLSKSINITPVETAAIKQMEQNGAKDLTHLGTLEDGQFEKAYLDAMVKGHKAALAKIDVYLKKVDNKPLKDHLTATRAVVATHLTDALDLQKKEKK